MMQLEIKTSTIGFSGPLTSHTAIAIAAQGTLLIFVLPCLSISFGPRIEFLLQFNCCFRFLFLFIQHYCLKMHLPAVLTFVYATYAYDILVSTWCLCVRLLSWRSTLGFSRKTGQGRAFNETPKSLLEIRPGLHVFPEATT